MKQVGPFALDHCAYCGHEIAPDETKLGGLAIGGPPTVHRRCMLTNLYLLSLPLEGRKGAQRFEYVPGYALPCSVCGGLMLTVDDLLWPHGKGVGMPDRHAHCDAPK